MNPPTKQQWLDFISEQKESNLSIAAFCRDKKISADNFYYHRRAQLKTVPSENTPFVRAQLKTEALLIKEQPSLTLNVGRSAY